MPVGTTINCLVVFLGGLIGWLTGKYVPSRIQKLLPEVFGFCAMAIGIVSIIKVKTLPAVILAVVLGAAFGEGIKMEERVTGFFRWSLGKMPFVQKDMDMERYITIVAIFCVSGMGIFGVINEGITGDAALMLSKSVLDLFTAALFATVLGVSVSLIAIPQAVIFALLFACSKLIAPFLTETLLGDFNACGGILTIVAGLRMAKIKSLPIVSLIPALVLVFFTSYLWNLVF